MRAQLRLFCIAVQFLTRLPVPRWVAQGPFEPEWLNRAARYFALVGAGVGAGGALVALAALRLWPPPVAATLAVAFTVWLTVCFHEDGLADSFDALLGAAPRAKALEIMKDSRIGSYGAAALVLALLLRVLLLAELLRLHPLLGAAALVSSHTAARALAVLLMAALPYAGDEAHAKAKPLARSVRGVDAAWAVASALAVAVLLWAVLVPLAGPMPPLAPAGVARIGLVWLLALTALLWALHAWLRRRLGGFTGDTLGASEQLAEVVSLLVWVAAGTGGT